MIANWIALAFNDFGLAMFILALICILVNSVIRVQYDSFYEVVFKWVALLPLGLTGIYTFIAHAFFPAVSASNIGWPQSPFQWEVAMADLAVGVLGILSFKASYPFRLATVIASTCWLWGAAIGHIYQMVANRNFSAGNSGSWFWMDILIPLILIICIQKLRPVRRY